MIVRNESEIILRCLNSAIEMIDYLFVTFNGVNNRESSERVTEFINSNRENGKLINGRTFNSSLEIEFNFQDYRNEAYINAFNELKRLNIPREEQFFLLLDSDMILHSRLSKQELKNLIVSYDAVELIQSEPNGNEYSNIRLISNRIEWKCIGRTHEFWKGFTTSVENRSIVIPKDFVSIEDRSDGCNKKNKLSRDLELLIWGYNEEVFLKSNTSDELLPFNPIHLKRRYSFYLGMNYCALNEFKLAIKYFKKRIKLSGWREEVFYSNYMIGILYSALKMNSNREDKIKVYSDLSRTRLLDAWLYRPTRIEPLYNFCLNEMNHEIFNHDYFNTQVMMLVYMICRSIVNINPPNDKLFIESDIYRYKIKYLLYISSFYTSDHEIGVQMYNQLKKIKLPFNHQAAIESFKLKFNW
jgi:hypothetical protein